MTLWRALKILNALYQHSDEEIREASQIHQRYVRKVLCPQCKEQLISIGLANTAGQCLQCHIGNETPTTYD